jgi:hypothetical protein
MFPLLNFEPVLAAHHQGMAIRIEWHAQWRDAADSPHYQRPEGFTSIHHFLRPQRGPGSIFSIIAGFRHEVKCCGRPIF